jgi:hypothetical protein
MLIVPAARAAPCTSPNLLTIKQQIAVPAGHDLLDPKQFLPPLAGGGK